MTTPDAETTRIPEFFHLNNHWKQFRYFLVSLVVVLVVRMLENAVHEYAHAAVVVLSGGEVVGLPLVTPFGGFTRWRDVPGSWLPLVNISGTLVSVVVMLGVFLPLYTKAESSWARWIGYWGACVVPVNTVFYWFMSPFLASALNYDPIAFAYNLEITPIWIIGVIVAIPFSASVVWMVKATRSMRRRILSDPKYFHVFCLVLYYIISIGFPVVSYLNLLDQFIFW